MDRREFGKVAVGSVMFGLGGLFVNRGPEPVPDLSLVLRCKKCGAQYDPISEHEKYHAHVRRCGLDDTYLAACARAGVPEDEIGKVCVVEVEKLKAPAEFCLVSLPLTRRDFYCSWKPTCFEDLRAGDVFRVLTPTGYQREPSRWNGDNDRSRPPLRYRADSDAQRDPNNPHNAGLTGVRLDQSV